MQEWRRMLVDEKNRKECEVTCCVAKRKKDRRKRRKSEAHETDRKGVWLTPA